MDALNTLNAVNLEHGGGNAVNGHSEHCECYCKKVIYSYAVNDVNVGTLW